MILSICGTSALESTAKIRMPLNQPESSSTVLRRFRRAFIDFLFPPLCLVCRKPIATYAENFLCSGCASDITFSNSPLCTSCGIMFASRQGADHVCGACRAHPPRFEAARSVAVYEGVLRDAIHRLKYSGGLLFAKPLGRLLAQYGGQYFGGGAFDCITAVPLHRKRLRERGYNQSVELARAVSASWNVGLIVEGLHRIRETPQQTALSRAERSKNVRGAFIWKGARLAGERMLLIDDVYTSGATADACAAVLLKAGAGTVSVLTLAHTQ